MGEEPGAFRIHIYVLARGGEARQRYWIGVRARARGRTPVEPPLILKDDASTPPSPPQAHFSPWNEWGTPASAGQDPVNTRQNQPGG